MPSRVMGISCETVGLPIEVYQSNFCEKLETVNVIIDAFKAQLRAIKVQIRAINV